MQLTERKKAAVLALLIGVLAVYWGYKFFYAGRPAPAAPAKAPVEKRQAAARGPGRIKVDLYLLDLPKEPYNAAKNIFNPVYRKPELPKPGPLITVTPQPTPPPPPLPPPPPPRSQEAIDADNSREELNKFKVLGFLKRKGRTDVFLSLGGSSFIAGKGDNVTKDYYLDDIGSDYALLTDRKTKVQVRIKADFEGDKEKMVLLPGGKIGKSGGSKPVPAPKTAQKPGRK